MEACRCSTRALELVVRDLAGIHLRRQRAQLYFKRCRSLSTRTSLRQHETTKISTTEKGFIPFETAGTSKEIEAQDAGKIELAAEKEQGGEVVIESALTEAQEEDLGRPAILQGEGGVMAVPAVAEKEVGNAQETTGPTPEWVKPVEQKQSAREQNVKPRKNGKSEKPISEARKARKERRLAEGKLDQSKASLPLKSKAEQIAITSSQQAAQDEEHHEEENETDQVQSVLAKLDSDLEGPSIIEAQQSRAEKLAAKSADKKRRSQQRAAQKLESARRAVSDGEASKKKKLEIWQRDKSALQKKFGEKAWAPRKRLSPDSLDGIRALHASDPGTYTTEMLSQHFEVTPEAIRRILKSKWKPTPEEVEERRERWEKRGVKKWREMSEVHGMKPPKKWRVLHGVPNPKLEGRKKWEDPNSEKKAKVINEKTGKKERWRNLGKTRDEAGNVSLADRL
ncbi:Required for respiratory growth protein 9, mitochondrial [Cercospora beticola]|uniref:Required for respiratory growth protein 9, mitochondrial n=1 Tax=Cercospora beticola TaxID=122368 RepID=A0A2G5I7Q8_CERBT|nr:Required for respiratory growth protein 9, mitochondrial [Cercospora beticola]PIB00876.1 Required for respiratory growth protein 9, mitochondrial [Cercospora beticola]WPA95960.1 hypothetical protein RHO25_000565 [Cercospora beticola]